MAGMYSGEQGLRRLREIPNTKVMRWCLRERDEVERRDDGEKTIFAMSHPIYSQPRTLPSGRPALTSPSSAPVGRLAGWLAGCSITCPS